MSLSPIALVVAIPAALMKATLGCAEVQAAVVVTSVLLPSLNKALALNCRLLPRGILLVGGTIATDTRRLAAEREEDCPIWLAPQPVETTVSPTAKLSRMAHVQGRRLRSMRSIEIPPKNALGGRVAEMLNPRGIGLYLSARRPLHTAPSWAAFTSTAESSSNGLVKWK